MGDWYAFLQDVRALRELGGSESILLLLDRFFVSEMNSTSSTLSAIRVHDDVELEIDKDLGRFRNPDICSPSNCEDDGTNLVVNSA